MAAAFVTGTTVLCRGRVRGRGRRGGRAHALSCASQYASSSSGGESSCEEGRARRPPHLRPFHPRTAVPDSNRLGPGPPRDPDYSSSSEQSCDTVIYVGPGGAALSDRELTDDEDRKSVV